MTWVEALPVVGITFGALWLMFKSRSLTYHLSYRGALDERVPYSGHRERVRDQFHRRLTERDHRMAMYATEVEWIHPVWRPYSYPAEAE